MGQDWGIGDNWSNLSDNSSQTGLFDLNQDPALEAAKFIESQLALQQNDKEQSHPSSEASVENDWVQDVIDDIHSPIVSPNEPALYDTRRNFDEYSETIHFEDKLATEIGLLIRCNESPDEMLVMEGRALPELKDADKYSPFHLLKKVDEEEDGESLETDYAIVGGYKPTQFFYNAISSMFQNHCSNDDQSAMTSEGIASWMSQSLGGSKVGMFDKRVGAVLSRYSTHGSGVLTLRQFIHLYMDATVGDVNVVEKRRNKKLMQKVKLEQPTLKSVWRDLQNHGFESPSLRSKCSFQCCFFIFERSRQSRLTDCKLVREKLQEKIDEKSGRLHPQTMSINTIMDECEILDYPYDDRTSSQQETNSWEHNSDSLSTDKSSHKRVSLCADSKTPSRLRDGDFSKCFSIIDPLNFISPLCF